MPGRPVPPGPNAYGPRPGAGNRVQGIPASEKCAILRKWGRLETATASVAFGARQEALAGGHAAVRRFGDNLSTMSEGDQEKSKSQAKREAEALQALGERLAALSSEQLERIEMPEILRDALGKTRGIPQRGARRRHLQYIGTLMRRIDPQPLQEALDNLARGHQEGVRLFHQAEHWRDALLAGNDDVLTEILGRFPQADHQHLREQVRRARSERRADRPPRAARELFRTLEDLLQGERLSPGPGRLDASGERPG